MLDLPDIAIGAIIAALIASLFSFLGLVISKEQKTSEFRQAWIDSLRREISQFISAAYSIHASTVRETSEDKTDRYRPKADDLVLLDEAAAIIRLRLNPSESSSEKVLAKITEIGNMLDPAKGGSCKKPEGIDYKLLKKAEEDLISEASRLLKVEWNRVKRGEWTYVAAKWCVLIAVLGFLALAAFSFFGGDEVDPIAGETEQHGEGDSVEQPN